MSFPKPMLNSPVENDIVGFQFLEKVLQRVEAASASRKAVIEWAHAASIKQHIPNYAEIVNQINLCLAEIKPRLSMSELTQMLRATPIGEIESLLKRLQVMRRDVQ